LPRVTVAIPTWNRSPLLRQAIESVLGQTMADFELFVFDNASTDDTPDVMASIDDPRVTYVRNSENLGNLGNSALAMHAGTAPYLVVLYDDSFLLPDCLQRKADFLDDHPDVVLVHSAFEVYSPEGDLVAADESWTDLTADAIEDRDTFIERSFMRPCRIDISSAMTRREALADDQLAQEDYPADDQGLWLRIATRGSIGFLAQPLNGLRMVPGLTIGTGFHAYEDGRFVQTTMWAEAARMVMNRFVATQDWDPDERRRMHRLARRGSRLQFVKVLRVHVRMARSPLDVLRAFIDAFRAEPTLLLEPRLVLVIPGVSSAVGRLRSGRRRPVA
jgi:glycosyltransferase involved in cell wall biosynthesis